MEAASFTIRPNLCDISGGVGMVRNTDTCVQQHVVPDSNLWAKVPLGSEVENLGAEFGLWTVCAAQSC